jgi:hypothetical protein
VSANETRYMRVMMNLLNLRQVLNFDGDVFEEVGLFTYLHTLTTGKNEISEETMTRIDAGAGCHCSLQVSLSLELCAEQC